MASVPGAAGPGAPFPQWTYNTFSHQVSKVDNAGAKALAETAVWPDKLIFFTSQKAADAYAKSQGGGVDVSNSPVTGAANATGGAAQAVAKANPLSGLEGLAKILGDFFSGVTDGKMWRSLGWLLLGVLLLLAGVSLWVKDSVNPAQAAALAGL